MAAAARSHLDQRVGGGDTGDGRPPRALGCLMQDFYFFFQDNPGTLHHLYGPQNKNESAPRWWDRVTDVWAKVRGYFIAGCAPF